MFVHNLQVARKVNLFCLKSYLGDDKYLVTIHIFSWISEILLVWLLAIGENNLY